MATDTVEAIVAEMREELAHSVYTVEVTTAAFKGWADRLQSAHAAEVGALRDSQFEIVTERNRAIERAESAESRLREAERLIKDVADCIRPLEAAYVPFRDGRLGESLDAAIDRAMEDANA